MNKNWIWKRAQRVLGLVVRPADAHCDTEDGPAVTDGRRALETGNVNYALKWVQPSSEAEVRAAFDDAVRERARGAADAAEADRRFLETLVRVHRAGEGEDFDGIKPAGTELPAEVVAADRAVETGSVEALLTLIPEERRAGTEHRFRRALARKEYDVDDLVAARQYVEAYVEFVKYAEGEESDAHHAHHAHHH